MSTTPNNTSTATSTTQPAISISEATLRNACQMAIKEDKPIMMDYYLGSLPGGFTRADGSRELAVIGLRENNEKMLVKSADEYTSTIAKSFKCGTEYIVHTENSIYIVSSQIKTKQVK
jgi:hypothetical protein